ncbi:hypothetical protein HAX54_013316 [Datura stramonium]|uniref:Putative plant transposon protein domain-containing protein n=1 Tax=Datura stramonium TaxID=4076 RepID=A0ABS8TMZ6_DATST|nr:hypothetical protein [Datura stramonium]
MAETIVVGQPHWAVLKGIIQCHDLKVEARMWLDLVCARIIPSKNTTHVPIDVAILVTCIMDCRHINVGEIIAEQFKRKARKSQPLFPILFSSVCFAFRPTASVQASGQNSES